ncbi:MAG: TetR/AcrR family transcriptional regulator [Salinibacter sp.]
MRTRYPDVFPTVRCPPIPDPDAFAERKDLVEAALRLHATPSDPPSVEAVCAEAGVDEATFYAHFDAPEGLYPAVYDLAVDQYRLLSAATEGYEDFTVEERLASFYYILLDALAEHRAFVQETFDSRVRYDSAFRDEVRAALRTILTDDRIPQPNRLVTGFWPVHAVLTEVTFALIRHWISDESADQAATTALVDRLVAFVAELVTFGGVSRGVDLAWHIVRNDALGLRRLPLVGRFLPGRGRPE